jgi:hypothetical protein
MNLSDWERLSSRKVTIHDAYPDARIVCMVWDVPTPYLELLWCLSDYQVGSVSGGSAWLVPRDPHDPRLKLTTCCRACGRIVPMYRAFATILVQPDAVAYTYHCPECHAVAEAEARKDRL